MSEHSIIIDMQAPTFSRFECYAPDGSPCYAKWECECETIWGYRVVGGSPVHDTTMEGAEGLGNAIHVGYFDNTQCNFTEWHGNQDEAVEGTVRVDVEPVNEVDYVTFTATAARIEVAA